MLANPTVVSGSWHFNQAKVEKCMFSLPIHDYDKDGGMYIFPGFIANVN